MRFPLCVLLCGCGAPIAVAVPDAGAGSDAGSLGCPSNDGVGFWSALSGTMGDVNRPDEALRLMGSMAVRDGGALVVSGAHGGGRLILTFTTPPATGFLPSPTMFPCEAAQSFLFYRPSGGDAGVGGGGSGTALLIISDGGVEADGGQLTHFRVTQLKPAPWISGPLPDRDFELVLP